MTRNKKQHFVPRSYLKAWCDPHTPKGHEPYVWRFAFDGESSSRKSPDNIFHETDMYTIHLPDGDRDLAIEHGLAQLEGEFVRVRDGAIAQQRKLRMSEYSVLCAFAIAMRERTRVQRDHMAGQWQQVLDLAEGMRQWAEGATENEKRAAASLSLGQSSQRISYEEVASLATQPLQTTLIPVVQKVTPLLAKLDCAVITALPEAEDFITSDNPCVWLDKDAHLRPPLYRAVGLACPGIEISLPISPRQLAFFTHQGISGYLPATQELVQEFNRRTRFEAAEYFVSRTNQTNPFWFDPAVAPADSWERRHPKSEPR